jgi:hypothetical protein
MEQDVASLPPGMAYLVLGSNDPSGTKRNQLTAFDFTLVVVAVLKCRFAKFCICLLTECCLQR